MNEVLTRAPDIPASAGNRQPLSIDSTATTVHPRVGGEAAGVPHLTAQCEDFFAVLPEMLPHLQDHWEELALDKDTIPLDPDWRSYRALYDAGKLVLITLRDRGVLAGYCWVIVAPGLHYSSSLHGTVDIFRVFPQCRGRHGGRRLFRAVEAELRRRGVKRWVASSKLHRDCGRLLEAIGMAPFETLYSKMLGGR